MVRQHYSPERRNVLALEYQMVALYISQVISRPPEIAQKFNYIQNLRNEQRF